MTINSLVYEYVSSEETYPGGATVIKEGSTGYWVYLILEGRVKIKKKTSKLPRSTQCPQFLNYHLIRSHLRIKNCPFTSTINKSRITPLLVNECKKILRPQKSSMRERLVLEMRRLMLSCLIRIQPLVDSFLMEPQSSTHT